jgi:predicted HTH domain antitoxin
MKLIIDYPESWPDALQQTPADFEAEAKMAMAVKLFEMKRISSGMAAQLVGMDRVAFLMSLHRFGVAMIDLDANELQSDVEHA